MGRLDQLRERAKGRVSIEMDAALTALFVGVPAWFIAHGVARGSWLWGLLALIAGPAAMALAYFVAGGLLSGPLGGRRGEHVAWGLTVAATLGLWWWPRYRVWALLPLAASVIPYLLSLRAPKNARSPELPEDVLTALAGLPGDLDAGARAIFEKALADREHVEETLARELRDDTTVDAAALRNDVAAALRAMVERGALTARLEQAAKGGSEKLAAAATEARAQLSALGGEIAAASEALLLYATARQPERADALRDRARSLRDTTAGLAEIAALERESR